MWRSPRSIVEGALAVAGAEAVGAYLALAGRAGEVYEEVEGEYGGRDLSVVYQWLQDKN